MKRLFSDSTVSLRVNSFWLLFARVSSQGLAIIFIALIARRLEPASFGQFTFIASIVFIGNTFTTFGTDTLLIREIARARQVSSLVHRALTLQFVLSAIWCFVLILLRMQMPLLVFSLSLFPLAIFSIVSALLRAFERMDLFWKLSLLSGLIQILCAVVATDLTTLCNFLLIGNLLTSLLAVKMVSVIAPDVNVFLLLDFRPILPIVLPFAALTTLSVISQRLGVLSTSILIDDTATGFFSSAARILDGMKFGHYAVLGALLPVLSREAFHSQQNYRFAFVGLLTMSIVLAGAVVLFARPILLFLFGMDYVSAVDIVKILAWCIVPYTVSAFLSVDLVARGKEIVLLRTTFVSMIVWIFLFGWWIKSFGLAGASWAALGGEIVQAIILLLSRPKSGIDHAIVKPAEKFLK